MQVWFLHALWCRQLLLRDEPVNANGGAERARSCSLGGRMPAGFSGLINECWPFFTPHAAPPSHTPPHTHTDTHTTTPLPRDSILPTLTRLCSACTHPAPVRSRKHRGMIQHYCCIWLLKGIMFSFFVIILKSLG